MKHTIGIDISKDELHVHRLPDGEQRRYRNTSVGHRALLKWLRTVAVARVVYEATGPYHRAMELALGTAGLPLVKVNPRQARRFAEAIGSQAKTDPLDAAMLARMGVTIEPECRPVPDRQMADLKDLRRAHQALVKDRTAAKNRAKHLRLAILQRQNASRLRQIEDDIKAIEEAMMEIVEQDQSLAERFDILVSIPGIAKRSALAMLVDMPELGAIENKNAASLAGLAPVTRQSGTWKGRSFIKGGRANLRQALYMPALVAIRFNHELKAKYDALVAAGKPPKVAITAVMRKLIVLANALLREQRKWSPNRP